MRPFSADRHQLDMCKRTHSVVDSPQIRLFCHELDGISLEINNKKCVPIEFKRTQDYRHTYEERARNRASDQYKSLLEGLQAIGSCKGWQIQQLVFVGGACGSVG